MNIERQTGTYTADVVSLGEFETYHRIPAGYTDLSLLLHEAAGEQVSGGHSLYLDGFGPVSRPGARGRATSVYFLDPDGNEIELRCY